MIRVKTKLEDRGLIEPRPQEGGAEMEYGYGVYVNAYVYDDECGIDDDEPMGLYATERIGRQDQYDPVILAAAKRRARQRARYRYVREKQIERGEV